MHEEKARIQCVVEFLNFRVKIVLKICEHEFIGNGVDLKLKPVQIFLIPTFFSSEIKELYCTIVSWKHHACLFLTIK